MAFKIKRCQKGLIEISDLVEEGGYLIRSWPDGRIELYEIPQYGGDERFFDYYPTINEAIVTGEAWT